MAKLSLNRIVDSRSSGNSKSGADFPDSDEEPNESRKVIKKTRQNVTVVYELYSEAFI